jgi:RNA polymerase sigma-70 factor (ECF subfamily)
LCIFESVKVFGYSRAESGQILAALINFCKDISLAEDSLQDAYVHAMQQWKVNTPKNQTARLFTVAKLRLIDKVRHSNLLNKE